MECCNTRKKYYEFENGTTVWATDYPSAIVKLHSTNGSKFTIEEIGEYRWYCQFSPDVFVEFECPSEHKARMHGPWLLHLDRRVHRAY